MNMGKIRGICRGGSRYSNLLGLAVLAFIPGASLQAATIYWDGTGSSWNSVGAWSTSISSTTDPASVPVSGDTAIFNINGVNSLQTVNLNANQSVGGVGGLSFNLNATGGVILQGGGTDRTLTVGAAGIGINAAAGAVTIGSATSGQGVSLILGGNQNWVNNSASLLTINNGVTNNVASTITLNGSGSGGVTINGIISNGTGSTSLTVNNASGTGVNTLTAANTYTGNTTVTKGTLTVSGVNGALANTTLTVSNGGIFILDDRGVSSSNGNRLGTSGITLNNGSSFQYLGSDETSTNSTETIGGITLASGLSKILVQYNSTNSAVVTTGTATGGFIRTVSSGGIGFINGVNLGKDSASTTSVARLILGTAPSGTSLVGTTAATTTGINSLVKNTRIDPFLVGEATVTTGGLGTATGTANTFLTYNATTGLRPLNPTDEFTNNSIVAGDNTYITAATTAATTAAINSLVINGGNLSINNGVTLTNTSGAILFAGSNSINPTGTTGVLDFGAAEGIVSLNSGVTATINAAISGTNGITVYGLGSSPSTLVLGGSSTYSGSTYLTNTNLVLGDNNALGTSTLRYTGSTSLRGNGTPLVIGNKIVLSNSTLNIGGSSDITLTGSGGGPAIAVSNFANQALIVTNTGTTTISGTFSLADITTGANNGNAFLNLGSGVNVLVTGAIQDNNSGNAATGGDANITFTGVGSNVTINPSANNAYGTGKFTRVAVNLQGYNTLTVGGPGGSGATITPFGASTLSLNNDKGFYFAAATNGQILGNNIVGQASGVGFGFVGANSLTLGGTYTLGNGNTFTNLATGTFTFNNTVTVGTSTFNIAGPGSTVFSGSSTFAGTTGSLAKIGSGTLTLAGTNSLTGTNSFSGGTVILDYSAANTNRLSAGTTTTALTLAGADLQLKGGAYAQTLGSGGGTTINVGSSKISQTSSGTSTLNMGAIARGANNGGVINFAAGAIVTSATANTNDILGQGWATVGGTDWARNAAGDIVALSTYDSFTTPGTFKNILQNNSATLAATTTVNTLKLTTSTSGQSLDIGSGQILTLSGNGLLFTGSNAYTITNGTLRGNTGAAGDLVVHQNGSADLTINSVIANGASGSGLTKAGTGTLILGGANTYTGSTYIVGGTLQVSSSGNLGSGGLVLDSGTLQVTTGFNTTRNVALGANGGTIQLDAGTMNLSGVVSGGSYGALNKTGTGTLILSGANTYTGETNINAGTLQLANAAALGASATGSNRSAAPVNVNGGTLDINGTVAAVGNFYLNSGTVSDSAGGGSLAAYSFNLQAGTVGAVLTDLAVAGSLNNATNLTKTGAGTATITSNNTYTGNTIVSAGTLLVNGSLASGSAVKIEAGTLGGSGTVGGLVTTTGTTSKISPGNSPGTLTLSGGLNAAAGADFVFELGISSDLLSLGSGVFTGSTAANGLVFEFSNSGGMLAGTTYTLMTFGSATGLDYTDLLANTLPSGFILDSAFGTGGFQINGTNLQVQFSAVPEPSTYALLGMGLVTLFWLRRRAVRKR